VFATLTRRVLKWTAIGGLSAVGAAVAVFFLVNKFASHGPGMNGLAVAPQAGSSSGALQTKEGGASFTFRVPDSQTPDTKQAEQSGSAVAPIPQRGTDPVTPVSVPPADQEALGNVAALARCLRDVPAEHGLGVHEALRTAGRPGHAERRRRALGLARALERWPLRHLHHRLFARHDDRPARLPAGAPLRLDLGVHHDAGGRRLPGRRARRAVLSAAPTR
jgi:hypothetical protein